MNCSFSFQSTIAALEWFWRDRFSGFFRYISISPSVITLWLHDYIVMWLSKREMLRNWHTNSIDDISTNINFQKLKFSFTLIFENLWSKLCTLLGLHSPHLKYPVDQCNKIHFVDPNRTTMKQKWNSQPKTCRRWAALSVDDSSEIWFQLHSFYYLHALSI